ncbi:hypothetical protein [Pseudovibrio brasiliensis]|uniref:Chromosome partition protein Smc n=1 Tax=Pseudovibrio brasiliensis TaxID=1898042 RepID=A0ABX8ARK3_9HYPH|nr:hypothetical protein [Pseudovibrio brasiliensis]QUS57708.1 hypothetical protein KGB56_10115 [Pseudovibrio brasiliensis]
MPENDLPQEHETWAHEVLKAIKVGYNVEFDLEEDEQVSDGDNGHKKAAVSQAQETPPEATTEQPDLKDLAAQKALHQKEISKASRNLKSLAKAVHIAGKRSDVFIEDVTKKVLDDAKQLAQANIRQANEIMNKPNKKGFVDLDKMQAFMDRGEEYLRIMQTNFKEGQEISVEGMKGLSAELQKKADDLHKQRTPAEAWGVDLSRLDDVHEQTCDRLTELNKALNGGSVATAKQNMLAASNNLAILREVLAKAQTQVETAKKDVEDRVQATETAAAELSARKAEIEHDPKVLADFEKEHDAVVADCKQASANASAGKGVEAVKAIESAEAHFSALQQVMLQSLASSPETPQDEGGNQSEVKVLLGDAIELTKKADELATQEDLIKGSNGLLPQFKDADKSARAAIAEAQNDLLTGDVTAAETKLIRAKHNLSAMRGLTIEAQSAIDIAAEQLSLLQRQVAPMIARRQEYVKLAETDDRNIRYLERFDEVVGEVENHISQAGTAIAKENLSQANQEIAYGQAAVPGLQREVKKLQYLNTVKTAATKEENAELFAQTLDKLREDIAYFNDRDDVFKDKEESSIFDNLYERAVNYANQAEILFKRKKFEEADEAIDNSNIVLSGLEIAYERGVQTAAKVEQLKLEVKEAAEKIQSFENVAKAIVNEELRGEFLSYKIVATDYVNEALDYINQGRITDALSALADLKQAMTNLNGFLTNPPQPKQPEGMQLDESEWEIIEENPSEEQLAKKQEHEDLVLFASELKLLLDEIKQMKTAVKEGHKVWERFCTGDYLQRFQTAFEQANSNLSEATDWTLNAGKMTTPGPKMRENQELFLASARQPLSEAKKAYREMQNAFDVSKQIMTSELSGLASGAKYYLAAIEGIHKIQEYVRGWDVDLSTFDAAYLTAMDNLAELKVAIESQDLVTARECLDKAETDRQDFLKSADLALNQRATEHSQLVVLNADVQSEYMEASIQRGRVESLPELKKAYDSLETEILNGFKTVEDLVDAEAGKAATVELLKIREINIKLQDVLVDAGIALANAELDDIAQGLAETTVFQMRRDKILEDADKLAEVAPASYEKWLPFCRGDYEDIFNQYFEGLKQSVEELHKISQGVERADFAAVTEKMRELLKDARDYYSSMEGIRNVSEQFVNSQLKGLNKWADLHEKRIDNVSLSLDKYADWGLDFADFDASYSEAKDLIEQMRGALQRRDYLEARDLNALVASAVKAVEDERESYASLFEDAKASFAEGFEDYRQQIAEVVKRRPELENIKHLAAAFDDCERSAIQAIERALDLIKIGDRFGPDKESALISRQENMMLQYLMDARPLSDDPEKLGSTINESEQKLAEFEAMKKDIKDGMDREIFEAMQARGAEHAAQALLLMEQKDYEKAEFELFALRVVNEALQSRHDSGVEIGDKIPELEQEIEDVTTDLADMEKLRDTIKNEEDAALYGKYHSVGYRTALEAKDYLLNDQIRRAQAALNTLQYYLDKMEEILDKQGAKGPKRKSGNKKSELESELANAGQSTVKPSEKLAQEQRLEREDSFDPDDEEKRSSLQDAITATDKLLETAKANAKDLLDASEAEYYGMILQKAEEHTAAAKDHLADAKFEEGENSVEYLKVALDTLHDAHKVGLSTSRLVPGYEKELDEIGKELNLIYLKRNTVSDAKDLAEFDKARNDASVCVFNIARLLRDKNIRKVKYEMEALRSHMGNLNKVLGRHVSRRQKLKDMLKRKKK